MLVESQRPVMACDLVPAGISTPAHETCVAPEESAAALGMAMLLSELTELLKDCHGPRTAAACMTSTTENVAVRERVYRRPDACAAF